MRLLCQILSEQFTRAVDGNVVIFIHRADNQLRTIKFFEFASGFLQALLKLLDGFVIVFNWNTVVHNDTIRNPTSHFDHFSASSADVNRDMPGLAASVNNVQFDLMHPDELAFKADAFHIQKTLQNCDGFFHRL